MPTIINNRSSLITDPLRNFRFLVTFKPIPTASTATTNLAAATTFGFTSVSGMAVTTDSIPYREGGYNTTVHQIPGQTTFAPITLQRGVILGTNQNYEWMRNLFATVQGGGSTRSKEQNFRCNLEIQVLSHPIPGAIELDAVGDSQFVTTEFVCALTKYVFPPLCDKPGKLHIELRDPSGIFFLAFPFTITSSLVGYQ